MHAVHFQDYELAGCLTPSVDLLQADLTAGDSDEWYFRYGSTDALIAYVQLQQ